MAFALRAGLSYSQHPLIAALQNGLQTLFQSPTSLAELLPPILLAVPKSRVSHSRKRMRAANKHLKEKDNIVTCAGCGRAKAGHNFCPHCYSSITRGFKTQVKQQQRATLRRDGPSTSSSSSEDSLADADWVKQRGGAIPVQEGQHLTKWMRARLGYSKSDPAVKLGQEGQVRPSKPRKSSPEAMNEEEDNDDDHHHHGGPGGSDMPSNLRFA